MRNFYSLVHSWEKMFFLGGEVGLVFPNPKFSLAKPKLETAAGKCEKLGNA